MPETLESLSRKFTIADPDMLEDSRTTHALFTEDLPAFNAFDASFDTIFADEWLATIDAGDGAPTDELYRDQLQIKTASVSAAKTACRAKYNEIKYFVQRAFPTNKEVQQSFGLDDYDKVRRSDTRLQEFMRRLHETATTNQAALIAANYSAAKIAEILPLAVALTDVNTQQEVFAKDQPKATRARIEIMNSVWASRTLVAAASKLVYANDFVKYQQYLLPSSDAAAEDFAITGKVLDAENNQPLKGVRVRIESLTTSVLTDAAGKYGFADNMPPATYTLVFEILDYVAQTKSVTVTSADETITVNVNLVKE